MAIDVDLDQGFGDTPIPLSLEVKDLLAREMPHEVFVAELDEETYWEVVTKTTEKVEDLPPLSLIESFLEPVAATPTMWVNSFPDPSQDSLFWGNPRRLTYIHLQFPLTNGLGRRGP
jgi:hypothetical protein